MSTQHTPGPWTARIQKQSPRYRGRNLGWIIETARGDRIGWSHWGDIETNKDDGQDTPISGANARLIAAAPDLLDCCRAMLELHDTGSWGAPPGEYLPTLRAAVAKATGEPS